MTLHRIHQHHDARPPRQWTAHAACQDADPGLFFPFTWEDLPRQDHARRICQACPVQAACLDWALRTGEPEGMWGGTTPAERRLLRAPIPAGQDVTVSLRGGVGVEAPARGPRAAPASLEGQHEPV
ncbi:WhiB family transcriptional regulator [Nonomuraea sp. M3C6]|uniref:Transcriptional regulator WhiB n=1 Tax=Nonomuraea marmarensis TaxID=3351344 RepID=A0ABW7AH35_9ACTN